MDTSFPGGGDTGFSGGIEVDSGGTVTAKTEGTAMVTAVTCDGYSASCVVTVAEPVRTYNITGTVISHGEPLENVTVRLLQNANEIARQEMLNGNYVLADVEPGDYVMQVSKAGHVTREYPVTVGAEAVNLDTEIRLLGDVDGNGAVDARDKRLIYNHIAGTALTGYEFQVGDVDASGVIDARDKRMIYNHISGMSMLW